MTNNGLEINDKAQSEIYELRQMADTLSKIAALGANEDISSVNITFDRTLSKAKVTVRSTRTRWIDARS